MIETAMTLTSDKGIVLTVQELGNVILTANSFPKMTPTDKNKYKELTLDRWCQEVKQESKVNDIDDKKDMVVAFHSITDRHRDLKGKEELVHGHVKRISATFKEANLEINNLQMATAALAFENHERVPYQIWIVPAGQGKSIIHAGLTFLFLENTEYDVYVVFQNTVLQEIDKKRN